VANENADKLKALRADYQKTFGSDEGKKVLADLEKVCMFKASTFDKEAPIMAFQEGLRAVYLHITTVMTLDIEQLEKIAVSQQS